MATFLHPLGPFVMEAFADEPCHDAIKIAVLLGAPMESAKGLKAYKVVAEDVLEVLRKQGLLVRDEVGWYRSVVGEQLGG